MTVHDIEYFFFREIRRIRGKAIKAYQKGTLSAARVLRVFAVVVLLGSIININLKSEVSAPVVKDEGVVLSAQALVPSPTPLPVPRRIDSSPDLEPILAKSALVIDATSSAVLFQKDSGLLLPPASTTKIVTALVALNSFGLNESVIVPEVCTKINGGTVMGLKIGETISVENLLYGLLIPSAADSACALSFHGGGNSDQFISRMNTEAKSLGMVNTTFVNSTGLDLENGGNVSTAEDLLKATIFALNNPTFRKIAGTYKITVRSEDGKILHNLINTNELLNTLPGVTGVKTGYTEKAGGCLVFVYNLQGKEIIGVVLGSTERGRFEDTKKILDWITRVYNWQ